MFDKDIIKLAWMSLWRRKLRTILTMIGIMIGTAGIVIMISLGAGLERTVAGEFEGMNMTSIEVYPSYENVDESGAETVKILKKDDVVDLEKLDGVKAVTPIYNFYGELNIGRDRISTQLIGIDMHVAKDLGYEFEDGRLPRNSEVLLGNKVLEDIKKVIGDDDIIRKPVKIITAGIGEVIETEESTDTTDTQESTESTDTQESTESQDTEELAGTIETQETQDTQEPVENEYRSRVVGTLKATGGSEDYAAIMDIDALVEIAQDNNNQTDIIEKEGYSTIRVVAENTEVVDQLSKEITEMGYMAYSTKDMLESIGSVFKYLQIFLGGIGSIALLVAAIGITNTMIMSIYERTKEIGVNKVIGASVKDVRAQFLYEASFIGLMGGVAGLVISYLITLLINFIAGMIINAQAGTTETINIAYIPVWLAIFAITFSIIIGVLAGLYPANRAAKISVLEALRQE